MSRENMKYIVNPASRLMLFVLLFIAGVLTVAGCGGIQGETATERRVRYRNIVRTNIGSMKDDVDTILLLDKRSKLNDRLIRDY
jgi:hypothetical protein